MLLISEEASNEAYIFYIRHTNGYWPIEKIENPEADTIILGKII
jgi:hypothetical protein